MRASIRKVCEQIAELDAAGTGLVAVQSSSFADIVEAAGQYTFKTRREVPVAKSLVSTPPWDKTITTISESNMYEVCGTYVREFGSGIDSKKITASATNGNLFKKLCDAVDDPGPQMFFFHDLADMMPDKEERESGQLSYSLTYIVRMLCDAKRLGQNRTLMIAACWDGVVPEQLAEYAYIVEVPYPEADEIKEIMDEVLRDCMDEDYFALPAPLSNEITEALRGFRASEIRNVIQQAFSEAELPLENNAAVLMERVVKVKRQILKKSGGLQWIEPECELVSGLDLLQTWIGGQRVFFHNFAACATHQEDLPKGVLVAGVPGSGKSLMAKNMARIWEIPLVKMDMGSLMGKYLGESEANVAQALRLAEALSPCVLWIDELEKAFAGVNGDGEGNQAMMRVFHSFLTWLQDRKKPCFVFATANNVSNLPSEFLRKERFDDKFYVFMPTARECQDIIVSHLRNKMEAFTELRHIADGKARQETFGDLAQTIAERLVKAAAAREKFLTGADISSIVKSAFRNLFLQRFPQLHRDEQALAASRRVLYYTADDVAAALEGELAATKTYGENMSQVVQYWMSLLGENPFRNASPPLAGKYDIDQKQFDQETGTFHWLEDKTNYDAELEKRLAEARKQEAYDDCFALKLALALRKTFREKGGK